KDPRRRYESALALADDLRRFLAHEPIYARPATSWERGIKWIKRRPTKAAFLGCLALAVLGFSAQAAIQAASQARAARQRLEDARVEASTILLRAQEAVNNQAWSAAEELLASAEAKIEAEPALEQLPGEAGDLIPLIRGRVTAHRTLQRFLQRRDE